MVKPQIREFRLGELKLARYNPRVISDEAMAGLTASIIKFGCVEPIIVNIRRGKNTIIGGHQRFRVLQELHGSRHKCMCVTVNLNKTDEKLLNLTLNNPHCQGKFVEDLVKRIDSSTPLGMTGGNSG